MRSFHLLLPILAFPILLSACGKDDTDDSKTPDDTEADTDSDTDADTDTDTDTDADTDTDTDTDDTGHHENPQDILAFRTPKHIDAQLVVVQASEDWQTIPQMSEVVCTLNSTKEGFGGTCKPGDETLTESEVWGTTAGNFVAFGFDDANHNNQREADEDILAMSWYGLVYLGGEPSAELAGAGAEQGWNAVDVFTWEARGELPLTDHRDLVLEPNVEGLPVAQFSGTVGYEASANARLAVHYPGKRSVTVDLGPLEDPWSVEVSGDPEASALRPLEDTIEQARAMMIVYGDDNGNSEYDGDEEIEAVMYDSGGAQIGVAWTTPPENAPNLTMRLLINTSLVRFGWSPVKQSGARPPTSTEDAIVAPLPE